MYMRDIPDKSKKSRSPRKSHKSRRKSSRSRSRSRDRDRDRRHHRSRSKSKHRSRHRSKSKSRHRSRSKSISLDKFVGGKWVSPGRSPTRKSHSQIQKKAIEDARRRINKEIFGSEKTPEKEKEEDKEEAEEDKIDPIDAYVQSLMTDSSL